MSLRRVVNNNSNPYIVTIFMPTIVAPTIRCLPSFLPSSGIRFARRGGGDAGGAGGAAAAGEAAEAVEAPAATEGGPGRPARQPHGGDGERRHGGAEGEEEGWRVSR